MIWLLTIIRLVTPLFIFKKPKLTIFLAILFDSLDYQFFPRFNGWYEYYAHWDKVLDTYQYVVFIFYISKHWPAGMNKKVSYGLFAIRMVGVLLFELTAWRFLLFIFPDVFENFFVYRVYIQDSTKKIFSALVELPTVISATVLSLLKLIQEYYLHIKQVFPWQMSTGEVISGNNAVSQFINGGIWVTIFLLLNVCCLWLVAGYWKQRRHSL